MSFSTGIMQKLIPPVRGATQRARIKTYLYTYIYLVAAAWIAGAIAVMSWPMALAATLNLIACLIFLMALRAEKLAIVRVGLPFCLVAGTTFVSATNAGVHDIAISVYMVAIISAAFFLGSSGTIATFVLVLIGFTIVFSLEVTGQISPVIQLGFPKTLLYFLIIYSLITAAIFAFFRIIRWDLSIAESEKVRAMQAQAFLTRKTEELRVSEARYKILAENSSDVVWTTNLKGGLTFLSPSIYGFVGFSPKEWESRSIHQQMTLESAKLMREIITTQLETEKSGLADPDRVVTEELTYNHRDGHQVHGEFRANFMRDSAGQATGLLFVTRDVSERRAAQDRERELRALAFRAQKMESLGVLAGGIAHDFNNLVMAIEANIDLARSELPPEFKNNSSLSIAAEACKDAAALSFRLLTFSAGGTPVKSPVALPDIVRDSVNLAAAGDNIAVDIKIEDDLPNINADIGQIKQVLTNLGLNASQSMSGEGTLWVTVEATDIFEGSGLSLSPGRYVHLIFRDEGIGIEEKEIDKIFDPFFTTKETGSGLGLTSSYSIIKQHGGIIIVESTLGYGSSFHIYLPASLETTVPVSDLDAGIISGVGRVLVMDDDQRIRKLTGRYLQKLGYRFDLAEHGEDAIKKFDTAFKDQMPYDAVILDLTVRGGMGGEEAIKGLLKIDPSAKVIVASGHANNLIMANHADFGFSGALSKPYKIQSLGNILNRVLSKGD
ncbi:sensory box histidine kinase/response regulator [marine gamma proteobacterium HTCC2143]|uniref:histidine kinase n=1 Tax=marine gamma proteobacterium HTCC2143 TaxID=247633 RepID=A0YEE8_9GAMM|nr:sensory box histidine kinase/response regulator [marine gamma proteobacterium HTCC2143]